MAPSALQGGAGSQHTHTRTVSGSVRGRRAGSVTPSSSRRSSPVPRANTSGAGGSSSGSPPTSRPSPERVRAKSVNL